jgi:hypothetical protein
MSGFRSRIGRLPSCAIVDFDRLRRQLVIKLFVPLRDQRTDRKGLQARRGRRGPRARFDMPASPDALGRRRSLLARLVLRKSGHFSTRLHGPPDAPSGRKARERSGDGATVCETLDYTPHIAREERFKGRAEVYESGPEFDFVAEALGEPRRRAISSQCGGEGDDRTGSRIKS